MNDAVIISKRELIETIRQAAESKPVYYKFPEEIRDMLGGEKYGPALSTIRGWASYYGLKTIRIGGKSYVTPADWDWWVDNNTELIAASGRTPAARMGKKAAA